MFENIKGILDEERAEYQEFFELTKYLSSKRINTQFKNQGKYHAAAVMANIFSSSTKNVKIYAGNFNGDVCDLYVDFIRDFLNKGNEKDKVSLTILFEEDPNRNTLTFNLLQDYSINFKDKCNISISIAAKDAVSSFKNKVNNTTIHFTIGDDIMYRLETDTSNYKALCNYDDEEFCRKLNIHFASLSVDSKPVNMN